MYNCSECESDCKHPKITTFVLSDTGEPAGLWACAACGHKFVPPDLEMERDAERYRWLKSRDGLTLRSEPANSVWKRSDGTLFEATHQLVEGGMQHAPADSLDTMIDKAMGSGLGTV